jgi:Protein of unknown function (DUF3987)
MRGKTHIEAACVSLLGSTQPGRLAEYVRRAVSGGAGDDGLIQRFGLLVWPDQSPAWENIDRYPNSAARDAAWGCFVGFDSLDPGGIGAELTSPFQSVPVLRLDGEAHHLFLEWRTDLERNLRSGDLHPALASHLAKYRKLVPTLALINHLADAGHGMIGKDAMVRAPWVRISPSPPIDGQITTVMQRGHRKAFRLLIACLLRCASRGGMLKAIMLAYLMLAAVGCARSSSMPLSQDTVQITSSAALACGKTGAQKVAYQRAAVETIRRGYDRFVIIGGDAQSDIRVVGYTPTTASTTGSAAGTRYGNTATIYGSSNTVVTGGQPIYGGSHGQGLLVKMFRDGDPAGANALSARETLGPDWQDAVNKNKWTCL